MNDTTAGPSPLYRVSIDEPLNIWLGVAGSEPEVETLLAVSAEVARGRESTLVLCLPPELGPAEAARVLKLAGAVADTLVITASETDRLRWGALASGDLEALGRAAGRARVVIEPDPERAVIASMQWLRAGHAFCVLWPRERGLPALRVVIACGARWREAWDEPENGEFYTFPRGPDGACASNDRAPVGPVGPLGKDAKQEQGGIR